MYKNIIFTYDIPTYLSLLSTRDKYAALKYITYMQCSLLPLIWSDSFYLYG